MINNKPPLVTVVTPVYNGEKYLAQCIESVLAQTYSHWEYVIVNNCSTDNTSAILEKYTKDNSRIHLFNNKEFVDVIENHNIAFRHISSSSAYCKVLQADDYMFPQCLEKMVNLAKQNPSCGLIGAYVLWGNRVASDGIPFTSSVIPGDEVCRLTLLKKIYPFVNLSGLMIRYDLVRNRDPFLKEKKLHTDVESYYELLQNSDFGFVHQVLSFVRKHEDSLSATLAEPVNMYPLADLEILVKFGPVFLTEEEFQLQLSESLKAYYRILVKAIWQRRDDDFWKFHKDGLKTLGYPLRKKRLWTMWFFSVIDRITNKLQSVSDVV